MILFDKEKELFLQQIKATVETCLETHFIKVTQFNTSKKKNNVEVTIKEVCELFKVSRQTVYKWIKNAGFQHRKHSSKYLFKEYYITELKRFMDDNKISFERQSLSLIKEFNRKKLQQINR